jgi:hypothetical protein
MTNGSPFQTVYEGTIVFVSVAANTTVDQTVLLSGATPAGAFAGSSGPNGAAIHMELPNLQAGLTFCNAHAISSTSNNSFTVRFTNTTGGALTPTGTNAKLVQF